MRRLTGALVASLLSACIVATPLSGPGFVSGEDLAAAGVGQVIVSVTEAEIKNDDGAADLFWFYIRRIDEALSRSEGMIAASKRFEILGSRAWTMTVWRDEDSLRRFLETDAHKAAVRRVYEMIDRGRFVTFVAAPRDLPLNWEHVELRLVRDGREMIKAVAGPLSGSSRASGCRPWSADGGNRRAATLATACPGL
jgi:heme-degrading monooxygenase HmoA